MKFSWSALGGRFYAWAQFLGFPAKTPAPAGRQNIYFVPSNFDGSDEAPCIVPLDTWVAVHLRWRSRQVAECLPNHAQFPSPSAAQITPDTSPLPCLSRAPMSNAETDKTSRKHLPLWLWLFHIYHQYPKADMCHYRHFWQKSTFSNATESAKGLKAKFTQREHL